MHAPKVLIDATAIPVDRGGVGRYVDALVPALVACGVPLVVAAQARDAEAFGSSGAEIVPVGSVTARPARFAWEQTVLPLLARRVGAQVVHSPHYTMPFAVPVPVVVTVHDATFFSDPALHSTVKARFFRAATRLAVRRAAGIIVPSQATREEVIRFTAADRGRFTVALHGVDTAVFHPVDDSERRRVAAALGVAGKPYVAFLGTVEPRKNVAALIRAWVRACADIPGPPALVIAGARGWDGEVDAAAAEVPDRLRLVRTGYVPIGDLPGLLSGATVVAYPSLGEGFGLPVAEAMACGAAVLTTRRLSLPEVGGDAVAYSEPDVDSLSKALGALLSDPTARMRLGQAAVTRATELTWAASARQHVRAYAAAAR